ncbi:MAG: enoyl-CoA hydratase-related protein, partial [Sulfurimonas sp.]|nr:enoyl-CoA hydratase-related protein [Sulfurimonas sp.]
GGDIYASAEFDVRNTYKASLYRNEVKEAFYKLLDTFFINLKNDKKIPQTINPLNKKPDLSIDWAKDTTIEILKKINTFDSFPGLKDEILGLDVYLFGAWVEERLCGSTPKEILAKRDGAICLATIDGALWITHLKEPNRFKLPSTYVLKERLKGIKEQRIPLIFDKSYKTFYEISCDIENDVAYLHFNFHNGAFRAEQCMRLKYAIEYLKEQVKVLVLMGGDDFFSNGINLNILEDSKKSGEDGWSTINAINDLVKSVIFSDEIITVASLSKNAGAGGVFLASACDYVVAREDVVLNPHYKSLALSGSEYHTYSLFKRVQKHEAKKLLENCLPISASKAKSIGLVDVIYQLQSYKDDLKNFCKNLLIDENKFDDFIWDKEEYLEEHKEFIEKCKEMEIDVMHPEFWQEESEFHKLRYEFVYKICPTQTPLSLKV